MDIENNSLLKKAHQFATISLADQKRKSGELILDHCLRVAQILADYKITDSNTLAVAILHHSLSEGAATYQDINVEFGSDIAAMVDSFEKLRIIRLGQGMEDEFIENLRKMFLVLAKDLRVVLIKLADITDNLTTLEYLDPEKKKKIAKETLEIFAPLADRLGMSELKGQMQDLAFYHLNPTEYNWTIKNAKSSVNKLEQDLLKAKNKILVALKEENINPQIQSRVKHTYSLYTKLSRPEINKDFSKIYDLLAMRIIVDSKEDCYKILGIVNKLFKPYEDPMSDYIAHPKPNGYQSIHIRVYGPNDQPFEIQIRTSSMQEEAEYGIAAHWNYAEKKESGNFNHSQIKHGFTTSVEKLDWVKKLSAWQEEISDNQEFLKTIKTDLFGERIYVFTPKGDVKDLPTKATPVDFAYKIHSDLGGKTIGAKVNGKMVSLNHQLKNADVVEIIVAKDKTKKPNRDWLGFVATGIAKRKIKKAYI